MGFNLRYLPSVKKLKEKRKELQDDDAFLTWVYGKSDAQIGSSKSFKYLKQIKNERKTTDKQHNTEV